MTVAELIKRLEKCDPNKVVVFYNDDTYWNGTYLVTDVMDDMDCSLEETVALISDYDVRLEDEEDE